MFHCQITNRQSKLGEKLNKVVVQTRARTYTRWVRDEETKKWVEIEAGKGWEIVKELSASEEGLRLWNSWSPDERAGFLLHMN